MRMKLRTKNNSIKQCLEYSVQKNSSIKVCLWNSEQ